MLAYALLAFVPLVIAALVAAAACWGFGTVVSKQVVDDVTPLTLLPIQLAASSVLLLVVTAVRREPIALTPPVRKLAQQSRMTAWGLGE